MDILRPFCKKISKRNPLIARRQFNLHRGLVCIPKHQRMMVQNMVHVRVGAREQFVLFPMLFHLSRVIKCEPVREVLVVAPKSERGFTDNHFSLKLHLIAQSSAFAEYNRNHAMPVRRSQSPGIRSTIWRPG